MKTTKEPQLILGRSSARQFLKFLVLSAGVALALGAETGPARAVTHDVMVGSFSFSPAEIAILEGDAVRWTRVDGSHTVTEGTGCVADKPLFDEDINSFFPTFTFTFNDPGVFDYFCRPHCDLLSMMGSVTVNAASDVPGAERESGHAAVLGAWPNPARGRTSVEFSLPRRADVRITVHDVTGRVVCALADESFAPGRNAVEWDGTDGWGMVLPTGVYYVRLQGESLAAETKLVLIR